MTNSIPLPGEILADLLLEQYGDAVKAYQALPEDKRDWSPLGTGRPALSQMQEMSFQADVVLKLLRDDAPAGGRPTPEQLAAYGTASEAAGICLEKVAAFAEYLRPLSTEETQRMSLLPFGERSTARMAMGMYWNASYHEGQITYISGLAG